MATDETRIKVLEELVEAGELYLNLEDYIKAHEMAKIPRKENRQKVEPQLDLILLKCDIWKKIKELVQRLPSL